MNDDGKKYFATRWPALAYIMNMPLRCEKCGRGMEYHKWPCVDEETGDHLGDYRLWRCEACDVTVDLSRYGDA